MDNTHSPSISNIKLKSFMSNTDGAAIGVNILRKKSTERKETTL